MGYFTRIDHWQDVLTFAKNSQVRNRAIVERIQRGVLCHTKIDGSYIIDTEVTPPAKRLYASTPKAPHLNWPTNMPPSSELVWVARFADKHSVRSDALYRAILFGEIDGWGVSGRVLVKRTDAQAIIGR